jgi:hypothetical protein
LTGFRDELNLEIESLERNIQEVQEDIWHAKTQLFRDWKETLADGGLLESLLETQVPASQNASAAGLEARAKPISSPSETERYALEDSRGAALDYVTQKQLQLQDAQARFDNLRKHYEEQFHTYIARTEDGMILLDSRKTTTNLIQAAEEFEQARSVARKLGLTLDSADQESCFVDFPDDGYRESLEAQWIGHADRD